MIDESRLRHPKEHAIFVASVLASLGLMAAAIGLVEYGSEWLEVYPRLADLADGLRAAAIAALVSPPLLTVLRNTRRARVRGSSITLSPTQIPEIYGAYARLCDMLALHPAPELFLTEDAIEGVSHAYSAWRGDYVVLRPKFLEANLGELHDVYEFYLARELGRVRLQHTKWWDELLLSYVVQIPYLRNPLAHVRTYSHDRYALALAPGSVRGLIVQSSGRHMLKKLSVPEYLQQSLTFGGTWATVASLMQRQPHVALRVRQLHDAGLLDLDRFGPAVVPPDDAALRTAVPARAAQYEPGSDAETPSRSVS